MSDDRAAKRVQVLYFDGCPHHEPLVARLPTLLSYAGTVADVELVRVESEEDAQRLRFLGSPTVRVDGRDVEPGAERRAEFGLTCRLYRTSERPTGLPRDEWILAALGRADRPPAENMSPMVALLADRSAKDRLDDCPAAYRHLHRRVLRAFVEGHRPRAAELERWAADLDARASDALEALERRDLVWRDRASGDITVAYPFSGVPTAHTVRLAGSDSELYAMCAIDALGIPFLAGRRGLVRSRDRVTGQPIEVAIDPAGPAEWRPHDAVVVAAVTDRGPSLTSCCPNINFVSDRSRGEALVAASPHLRAAVVELAEAIEVGRRIFGSLLAGPEENDR